MLLAGLQLLGGLTLLCVGGEALVAGATRLALALRISPLVVGLTVVSFGTSSPELVVSFSAALSGTGDLAVGNVIGSNLCNIGCILGLAALVRPLQVQTQVIRFDVPILIAVSAVFVVFFADGRLSRPEALASCLCLLAYTWALVAMARRERAGGFEAVVGDPIAGPVASPSPRRGWDLGLVVVGLGTLTAGGQVFVSGALSLARHTGMSEAIIGLTVVAIGTSLPELATSVVASYRGQGDIAIGNVIGSNLFNLLGVLGLTGLISPLGLGGVQQADLFAMLAAPLALLPLLLTGRRFSRHEGALVLLLYVGYVAWRLGA